MGNLCDTPADAGRSGGPVARKQLWPGGGVAWPPAYEMDPAPTREALERMRAEFFDTRTEGDPNMWAVIRAAAAAFREGDAVLGNEMVRASGLMPADVGLAGEGLGTRWPPTAAGGWRALSPTGCCAGATMTRTLERAYDERGFLYETPRECLVDPERMAE